MKNRGRTEMLAAMLEVAKGKVTKTKIMYIAFLSNVQLKEYLPILIENNLIEYLDGDNKFKTTEKGLNYLNIHNESKKIVTTNYNNQKLTN
jgi:predicted transcriptional regulator